MPAVPSVGVLASKIIADHCVPSKSTTPGWPFNASGRTAVAGYRRARLASSRATLSGPWTGRGAAWTTPPPSLSSTTSGASTDIAVVTSPRPSASKNLATRADGVAAVDPDERGGAMSGSWTRSASSTRSGSSTRSESSTRWRARRSACRLAAALRSSNDPISSWR